MRLPQFSFQFPTANNAQPNAWPFQKWAMASATEESTPSPHWHQPATPPIPTYNPVPAQHNYWSNKAYIKQDHPIDNQNSFLFSNAQNTTWYQNGWPTHTSQPESSEAIRAFHLPGNMHTGITNISSPVLEQNIHSALRPGHHTELIPDDHTNNWHVDHDMLQPGKCEAVPLDSEYFAHQTHAINASSCRTHLATTDHSQQPLPSSKTAEGDVTYAGVEPLEDRYPPATFHEPISHHQGRRSLDWSTFEIAKALDSGEGQPATDGPDQKTESREVQEQQKTSRQVPETGVGADSEDNVLVERKAELPRQPNGREQTEPTEVASDTKATCSAREPTMTIPSPTTLGAEVKRKQDEVENPSSTDSTSATPTSSYDGSEPTSSQSSASTSSRRPRKVNKKSHRKAPKTKRGPRTPKAHQEIISGAKDEFTMFWVDPSCGKMGNPPIIQEDGLPRQTKRRRTAV